MTRDECERLIEAYRRDGFVAVRGLIDPAELAPLAAAVDAGVVRRKARDTRSLAEKTRYEQSFVQCQYMWEDSPDIRPLTLSRQYLPDGRRAGRRRGCAAVARSGAL